MSYPILYSATETNFDHNGIGILSACVSCEVTEEANGIFELAMQYPMDGVHFAEIGDRAIIKAKADQFREPQLFRVYAISKPMNGIVTVLAEHISYDLSGIPVKPFSAPTAASALSMLKDNAVVDCPFDFWTDKATFANFKVSVPASIRSRLGGVSGSILDVYGGEYEFDNFTVKLHNSRGQNRGVSIRYGKNLTDIKQDQNCSNVATGVYPYWVDSEGAVLVELPERIVNAPGTYNFVKIRTLDLSREFETQPTVEQLRSRTESYINANNIGIPSVSWSVSFAQLEQTEEYKHLKLLERVSLFDTVNVEFPALGVSATAKAVKMVYDVIADRVKSVTLGSVRANIADTISNQNTAISNQNTVIDSLGKEISTKPNRSELEKAKEDATAWLTNGKGYAYFRKDDLGNIADILFMDTQDASTAVDVMRVGQSGIGFSHNGVNGPYESAWTIDGKFNADFVAAGTLFGLLFKAGTIESVDGKIVIDLSTEGSAAKFSSGISANKYILRGDQIDAKMLMTASAARADERDTINIIFYTDDGYGVGGISNMFSQNNVPIGLQYRAFSLDEEGNRGNYVDINTSENGYAEFALRNSEGKAIGRIHTSGSENTESTLSVDNAYFSKLGGKDLIWRYSEELSAYVLSYE
jgi:phage minor structural protein